MTIRIRKKTVTFTRPFVLSGYDEVLPAGDYIVETDEELLDGISFPAYRRLLSLVHLHPKPDKPGLTRVLAIDPNELDAALMRDQAPAVTAAHTETVEKPQDRTPEIPSRKERPSNGQCKRSRRDDHSSKVNNRPPKAVQ